MENLFGKGLSAYPANWEQTWQREDEIDLGNYVEVIGGPYSELHGVVTYRERAYVWVRLDGDDYDLRFRLDLLRATG